MRTGHLMVAALAAAAGLASADFWIASYTQHFDGRLDHAGQFVLNPYFSVADPSEPGATGYMTGTLELEDFFTGTIHHLAGDLAGADAALTDGNDWPVYLGADSGAGYTDQVIVLESTLFAGAPGIEGFDLHGYVVTGISVMGTSLSVHNETDFEAGVLFMFRGYRVPGPGGLVCLLAGVGMAAGRRRG